MMARYKAPWMGSFQSPDPIDDVTLDVPWSWNKYAYVRGDPLRYLDPLGLGNVICIPFRVNGISTTACVDVDPQTVDVKASYSPIPRIPLPSPWIGISPGLRGGGRGRGGDQGPVDGQDERDVCGEAGAQKWDDVALALDVAALSVDALRMGITGAAALGVTFVGGVGGPVTAAGGGALAYAAATIITLPIGITGNVLATGATSSSMYADSLRGPGVESGTKWSVGLTIAGWIDYEPASGLALQAGAVYDDIRCRR
jgi:hypothetical protein